MSDQSHETSQPVDPKVEESLHNAFQDAAKLVEDLKEKAHPPFPDISNIPTIASTPSTPVKG